MAWYDYVPSVPFQIANGLSGGGPFGAEAGAVGWGQQRSNVPQIGANPYQGDWNSLITQLQNKAAGNGPSLAGDAYKQASQDSMNNIQSLAANGSAGGVRNAIQAQGKVTQGLAQGYSNARLQEQLAAQQQLGGALDSAGNAWFKPQEANLKAQMGTPDNLTKLLSFFTQLGPAGAAMGI